MLAVQICIIYWTILPGMIVLMIAQTLFPSIVLVLLAWRLIKFIHASRTRTCSRFSELKKVMVHQCETCCLSNIVSINKCPFSNVFVVCNMVTVQRQYIDADPI
jgi:hypothetical protein